MRGGAAGEDPLLDLLELDLEGVDHREVAVHDRVHEGIEDVPGAMAEQLGLPLTSRANLGEPPLAAVTDRKHVVPTDEHVHLAHAEVVAVRLDRLEHGEERGPVLLDLRALVPVPGVLDGERVEVELLLHLRQLGVGRVAERHPDEAVGPAARSRGSREG